MKYIGYDIVNEPVFIETLSTRIHDLDTPVSNICVRISSNNIQLVQWAQLPLDVEEEESEILHLK